MSDQTNTTTEANTEYRESNQVDFYEWGQDIEDMTREEMRADIAHAVGSRPVQSSLRKATLNSVGAYLTGEFSVPQHKFHLTTKSEVMEATIKAIISHEAYPYSELAVDECEAGANVAYMESKGALKLLYADLEAFDGPGMRALRSAELGEVIATMRAADDAREWTQ